MAMLDPTSLTQGGIAIAIAWMLLKYQSGRDKSQEIRDTAFVAALKDLSENSAKQTAATAAMAEAQTRTADEAEKRNGHLAEISVNGTTAIIEAVGAITERMDTNSATLKVDTAVHVNDRKKVASDLKANQGA